jgi:hypothetical protein
MPITDDKVVTIRGATLAQATGSPEPLVVKALRMALDKAERGEVVAVDIVTVKPNGKVSHSWQCPNEHGHPLVAGCTYLTQDLVANTTRRAVTSD